MAEIVLAQMQSGGGITKLAVVKRVRENLAEEEEYRNMFMDEARLASRLNHPNIVQTFDVDEDERGPYFVMEFLEGQPLSSLIKSAARKARRIPLAVAVTIVEQALAALHYAHEISDHAGMLLSIVHRDVSPQNVFVTYGGITKLLDFGVAKSAAAVAETRAGVLKGKVAYMSPEQMLEGSKVDRRADVFSAGVILWELMAERRFWDGQSDLQMLQSMQSGEARPSPKTAKPDLPQELVDVCMRAIHLNKDERYPTAEAFLLDLEAAREKVGLRATQSEIASLMTELFADERAKMRKAIESRIQSDIDIDVEEDASVSALLPLSGSGASSSRGRPPRVVFAEGTPVASHQPESSRNRWLVGAAGAALLVATGIVATRSTRGEEPRTLPANVAAVGSSAEVVTIAPSPTRSALVKVRISVTPSDAKLFIDGTAVSNPYVDMHSVDDKPHEIRAEGRNYETRTIQRAFSSDTELQLALAWKGIGGPVPGPAQPVKVAGSAKASVSAPPIGEITELKAKPKATAAPIDNPF
jgi:eukaryotic-like serine/threonine-protein kinase